MGVCTTLHHLSRSGPSLGPGCRGFVTLHPVGEGEGHFTLALCYPPTTLRHFSVDVYKIRVNVNPWSPRSRFLY